MSNILAVTYEDAVLCTKDDVKADPAGPFAGLLIAASAAGTIKFTTVRGHDVSIQYDAFDNIMVPIPIATSRVWATGTTATVYGLIAPPFKGSTPSV